MFGSSFNAIAITQCRANEINKRIQSASDILSDLSGRCTNGLTLHHVAGYTIVDDGHDRWIINSDLYADNVESVITDILDGSISLTYDTREDRKTAYDAVCGYSDCLYSNIGSPSDVDALLATFSRDDSLTADDIQRLLELLNIDLEGESMGTITVSLWADDLGDVDIDEYGQYLCEQLQPSFPLWVVEWREEQTIEAEYEIESDNKYFSGDDYLELKERLQQSPSYFDEFCRSR